MHSLKDELTFFFSGRGMPYEKVSLMVAVVVTVLLSILLGNNYAKDARVAVIDLDNSKYSHAIIDEMNASPFIKVTAVLNTPVDPKSLFYRDECIAAVYLPKDLEKNRYSQAAGSIGVFYDNTNSAQTADLKKALNEIVAHENQVGGMESSTAGSSALVLKERELFNPVNSNSNGEVLGVPLLLFIDVLCLCHDRHDTAPPAGREAGDRSQRQSVFDDAAAYPL
jgi:hypothetical protein